MWVCVCGGASITSMVLGMCKGCKGCEGASITSIVLGMRPWSMSSEDTISCSLLAQWGIYIIIIMLWMCQCVCIHHTPSHANVFGNPYAIISNGLTNMRGLGYETHLVTRSLMKGTQARGRPYDLPIYSASGGSVRVEIACPAFALAPHRRRIQAIYSLYTIHKCRLGD